MVEFIGFLVVVWILFVFGSLYTAIALAFLWILWQAKWIILILWIIYYCFFLV